MSRYKAMAQAAIKSLKGLARKGGDKWMQAVKSLKGNVDDLAKAHVSKGHVEDLVKALPKGMPGMGTLSEAARKARIDRLKDLGKNVAIAGSPAVAVGTGAGITYKALKNDDDKKLKKSASEIFHLAFMSKLADIYVDKNKSSIDPTTGLFAGAAGAAALAHPTSRGKLIDMGKYLEQKATGKKPKKREVNKADQAQQKPNQKDKLSGNAKQTRDAQGASKKSPNTPRGKSPIGDLDKQPKPKSKIKYTREKPKTHGIIEKQKTRSTAQAARDIKLDVAQAQKAKAKAEFSSHPRVLKQETAEQRLKNQQSISGRKELRELDRVSKARKGSAVSRADEVKKIDKHFKEKAPRPGGSMGEKPAISAKQSPVDTQKGGAKPGAIKDYGRPALRKEPSRWQKAKEYMFGSKASRERAIALRGQGQEPASGAKKFVQDKIEAAKNLSKGTRRASQSVGREAARKFKDVSRNVLKHREKVKGALPAGVKKVLHDKARSAGLTTAHEIEVARDAAKRMARKASGAAVRGAKYVAKVPGRAVSSLGKTLLKGLEWGKKVVLGSYQCDNLIKLANDLTIDSSKSRKALLERLRLMPYKREYVSRERLARLEAMHASNDARTRARKRKLKLMRQADSDNIDRARRAINPKLLAERASKNRAKWVAKSVSDIRKSITPAPVQKPIKNKAD